MTTSRKQYWLPFKGFVHITRFSSLLKIWTRGSIRHSNWNYREEIFWKNSSVTVVPGRLYNKLYIFRCVICSLNSLLKIPPSSATHVCIVCGSLIIVIDVLFVWHCLSEVLMVTLLFTNGRVWQRGVVIWPPNKMISLLFGKNDVNFRTGASLSGFNTMHQWLCD